MSRATELRLWPSMALMGLVLVASAPSQAQTIGDYSRSQRAVLESEMAKNIAKALSNGSTAPAGPPLTPHLVSPPSAPVPAAPPAESRPVETPPELAVTGVIVLQKRAMVELAVRGETVLVLLGDKVPRTAWTVASIRQDQVILKSGSKSMRLPLPTGAR